MMSMLRLTGLLLRLAGIFASDSFVDFLSYEPSSPSLTYQKDGKIFVISPLDLDIYGGEFYT